MTLDEAIGEAKKLICFATERIRQTGTILPMFQAFQSSGIAIYALAGDLMNSGDAKTALAIRLRAIVAAKPTEATLFLSDMYFAKPRTLDPGKQLLVKRVIDAFQLSVTQAAEMGLVDKAEALMVQVSLPDGEWAMVTQEYLRDPANESSVMVVGDPAVHSGSKIDAPVGRMCEWFKPPSVEEVETAERMGLTLVPLEQFTEAQ